MCENKPKISYPTFWNYKVIAEKNENLEEKICEILKNKQFKIEKSKKSSSEKYESLNVNVLVNCDNERQEIFFNLKKISKFVL